MDKKQWKGTPERCPKVLRKYAQVFNIENVHPSRVRYFYIFNFISIFFIDNQEHGGDLNEAVNAHFSEGDRNMYVPIMSVSLLFFFCPY